ncbi:MAG: InlB B-repeat-containing protein, partial [Bacteroidaceae bacterium]|nr:InlB B-repeat-containing protein [Bacteroidaceae bacterium]
MNTATGGSVAASIGGDAATTAKANQTVTLTVSPESGYKLSHINVVDAANNTVGVTGGWYSNNQVTFNMPASDITVTPTFTNTLTAAGGLYITMPTTDTKTVTIPSDVQSLKVYDDGGATGNYSNNCDGTLVLTAPEGYVLRLSGSIITYYYDYLTVYDGSDDTGTKLLDHVGEPEDGETVINTVTSTGRSMTLYFLSDYHINYAGLDLTVTLINTSNDFNITVCTATGGSVAASIGGENVTTAQANQTVTLTASPENGYMLSQINVVDATNNTVGVTGGWYSNNQVTFNMPASDVTVTPKFINNTMPIANGLYIYMPTTGTKTAIIPSGVQSFLVFDDGGGSNLSSNNCDGTLVLIAPEGYLLQLSGHIGTYTEDYLTVYDGSDNTGTKLLDQVNGDQKVITVSTGRSMTLYYYTDPSDTPSWGLDLTVTLVNPNTDYNITVNSTTGGSVAASVGGDAVTTAKANQTVTLTASPESGYVLNDLTVVDADKYSMAVTDMLWYNDATTATFTMHASAVTVTPKFTNTLTASGGLYINMPTTGSKTVTIPSGVQSFKVYDDGGSAEDYFGRYSDNCDGTLELIAPEGYVLQLSGNISIEEENDYLTVYDGNDNTCTILLDRISSSNVSIETAINTVTSTNRSMKLYFYSDGSENYAGLDLTVMLLRKSYTVSFNANGGSGDAMAMQTFNFGVAQDLTANTYTRTGYIFAGWATSAGGEVVYTDGQSVQDLTTVIGANIELFAKWTENVLTLLDDDSNSNTKNVNIIGSA